MNLIFFFLYFYGFNLKKKFIDEKKDLSKKINQFNKFFSSSWHIRIGVGISSTYTKCYKNSRKISFFFLKNKLKNKLMKISYKDSYKDKVNSKFLTNEEANKFLNILYTSFKNFKENKINFLKERKKIHPLYDNILYILDFIKNKKKSTFFHIMMLIYKNFDKNGINKNIYDNTNIVLDYIQKRTDSSGFQKLAYDFSIRNFFFDNELNLYEIWNSGNEKNEEILRKTNINIKNYQKNDNISSEEYFSYPIKKDNSPLKIEKNKIKKVIQNYNEEDNSEILCNFINNSSEDLNAIFFFLYGFRKEIILEKKQYLPKEYFEENQDNNENIKYSLPNYNQNNNQTILEEILKGFVNYEEIEFNSHEIEAFILGINDKFIFINFFVYMLNHSIEIEKYHFFRNDFFFGYEFFKNLYICFVISFLIPQIYFFNSFMDLAFGLGFIINIFPFIIKFWFIYDPYNNHFLIGSGIFFSKGIYGYENLLEEEEDNIPYLEYI